MTYYTEEQRKRGAETRRRNREWKKFTDGRIDAQDITRSQLEAVGIKVGKVAKPSKRPSPLDYSLPDGIEEAIKELDAEAADKRAIEVEKLRAERQTNFWLIVVFVVLPITVVALMWVESASDWFNAIATVLGIGLFPAIWLLVWGFSDPTPPTVKLDGMRKTYETYRSELRDWQYWERRRTRSHWGRMDGAKFEHEIASLFRLAGFRAEVTKASGDGGVDIILTHGNRLIAVQCKRYEKDVGPHVIRDLWGTMHHLGYDEGCIVTSAFFTQGVKDFASGKKIYLINMQDILRTVDDDGISYLQEKMKI